MKLVLDTFFDELGRAEQCALLLDYDGTLAPFQVDRSKAVPYPGIRQALERIITLQNTYVVVITGRGINDILPLLELSQLPEIWGSHGWERLTPEGTYEIAPLDGRAKAGLDRALQEVQNIGLSDRCE